MVLVPSAERPPFDSEADRMQRSLPWGRTWLVAVVFAVMLAAGEESYWRSRGFLPSVPDSPELWHFWRQRLCRPDGRAVALLGTSRLQSDMSLDLLRSAFPRSTVCQLGLPHGLGVLGVLESLADDDAFRGTVICEFYTSMLDPRLRDRHREIRDYRPASRLLWLWTLARQWLRGRLAVFSRTLSVRQILHILAVGRLHRHQALVFRAFDRETFWDFRWHADPQRLVDDEVRMYEAEYRRYGGVQSWDVLSKHVSHVERLVRRIRQRGGQVVFLRIPSTQGVWDLEQRQAPRSEHWDRFAAATSAITIHFRDVPLMASLACPDGSHLTHPDAVRFTRAFIGELGRRGVLPGSAESAEH